MRRRRKKYLSLLKKKDKEEDSVLPLTALEAQKKMMKENSRSTISTSGLEPSVTRARSVLRRMKIENGRSVRPVRLDRFSKNEILKLEGFPKLRRLHTINATKIRSRK